MGRSLSTNTLKRFLGSITIKSQGSGREFSGGSGAGQLSAGVNTQSPRKVSGKGINFSNWRKRDAPPPPVVKNNTPLIHQKGKPVVRVGALEQKRLTGGREEQRVRGAKEEEDGERKATGVKEAEGRRVEVGRILAARYGEEQRPWEGEIIERSSPKEPPDEVRDIFSRRFKIDTFITKIHPDLIDLPSERKAQPPTIQQHSPHLTPPMPPSLYGEVSSQQPAQPCSCGNTSTPPTQEAGFIEEAPVSVYVLDYTLLT